MNSLDRYPALVLNADYRPLSYFPLSTVPWKDAIQKVAEGKVEVVEVYERVVRSPSIEVRLPSVIALRDYVAPPKRVAFTRFNVFMRDAFTCQYCGDQHIKGGLTFEHVIPRSRGGQTTWTNIVAACEPCNTRKANRTPKEAGMPLRGIAREPSAYELMETGRRFPANHCHDTWRDYLYWDVELER